MGSKLNKREGNGAECTPVLSEGLTITEGGGMHEQLMGMRSRVRCWGALSLKTRGATGSLVRGIIHREGNVIVQKRKVTRA